MSFKFTSGECKVCHQPITSDRPADLVVIRSSVGRVTEGAKVHSEKCIDNSKVVHHYGRPQYADRIGFTRRSR